MVRNFRASNRSIRNKQCLAVVPAWGTVDQLIVCGTPSPQCAHTTHYHLFLQNKLLGNLGLGATCTSQLEFKTASGGPATSITVKGKRGESQTIPVYSNNDTICGTIKVTPTPGKRVEHQGIRVQLVGEIELATERGHSHEFLSLVRDLAPPGELFTQATFPFEFRSVEMEHESYRGMQVRLRYALRVIVARGLGQSVVKDHAFWVRNTTSEIPPIGAPIKMEVGIEDCLHIEFEYEKGAFHLTDTVVGRIYFLLVRIKLKHMELEIRRRETVGGGASARVETETVAKYEIMDGAPARGEVIPIRLFLAAYDLTPSYPNVHNKFGVRYSLNLVLVDEEDRRYFKQQEIMLYRNPEDAGLDGREAQGTVPALTPRTVARALAGNGSGTATPSSDRKEDASRGEGSSHEGEGNIKPRENEPPL